MNNLSCAAKTAIYGDSWVLGRVADVFSALGSIAGVVEYKNSHTDEQNIFNMACSGIGYMVNRICIVLSVSILTIAIICQFVKVLFLEMTYKISRLCEIKVFNINFNKYFIALKDKTRNLLVKSIFLSNYSDHIVKFLLRDNKTERSITNEDFIIGAKIHNHPILRAFEKIEFVKEDSSSQTLYSETTYENVK